MAQLFAEESSGSLFRNSTHQETKEIDIKDGVLHIAPSILSRLDPNLGKYVPVDKAAVIFARKDGEISAMPINSEKRVLTKFQCNSDLDWELQNGVYCSALDIASSRWLFLFPNAEEAEFATSIALFEKAKANGFQKVAESSECGEGFDATFYDLSEINSKKCSGSEEELNQIQDSVNGDMKGCVFVAAFQNGHVSIIKPSSKEQKLSEVSEGLNNKEKSDNNTEESVSEKRDKSSNEKSDLGSNKTEEKQIPAKKPKKRYPTDPASMKATCKGIEEIEKDISRLFEDLSDELSEMKVKFPVYDNVSMCDEAVLDGVIKLVEEAEKQEISLRTDADEIDRLFYETTAQDAAIEARSSEQEILKEIDREVANRKILEQDVVDLEARLKEIEKEIEGVEEDKVDENNEDYLNEEDFVQLSAEIEELNKQINEIAEEKGAIESAIDILSSENEKEDTPIVTMEEATRFRDESKDRIEEFVISLASKLNKAVTRSIAGKENVTGEEVINIVAHSLE